MQVLVTRPAEDALPLAEALRAAGHDPLCEPLLEIKDLEDVCVDLGGVTALAFTSANGVRALLRTMPEAAGMGLAVFAVGPASAEAARLAGFDTVASADGDVATLAALIGGRLGPADTVLHVAGRQRAGDLVAALAAAGIAARRTALYEAVAAETLSDEARAALAEGRVGAVLIFSPRTAKLFVSLMRDAGLAGRAAALTLVALSPAVAEAAAGLDWGAVAVAAAPNQDAALRALAEAAATA